MTWLFPVPIRFVAYAVATCLGLLGVFHLTYLLTGWVFGLVPVLSFAAASRAAAWLTGRQGGRLSGMAAFTGCGVAYAVVCPVVGWFGSAELGATTESSSCCSRCWRCWSCLSSQSGPAPLAKRRCGLTD